MVKTFDDGQDEQDSAAVFEKAIEASVEQLSDGRVDPAQRLLDPVDGTQEVTALNRLAAAEPDRDVLRIAAEPRHFVRHDLSDGDDEIVRAVDERSVDRKRQCEPERSADHLIDLVRGKLTDRRHVVAPPVVEQPRGVDRVAEHQPALGRPERPVRTERRHHVDLLDLILEQQRELRHDLPARECRRVWSGGTSSTRRAPVPRISSTRSRTERASSGRETSAFEPPPTSSGRPEIVGTFAE